MKQAIWKKAKKIIKYIVFEASTEFNEYYNFHFPSSPKDKDIQVTLHLGIRGTYWTCTCSNCSVHDTKHLCAQKIAVILFKYGVKE